MRITQSQIQYVDNIVERSNLSIVISEYIEVDIIWLPSVGLYHAIVWNYKDYEKFLDPKHWQVLDYFETTEEALEAAKEEIKRLNMED